jgi:hypothetical protein
MKSHRAVSQRAKDTAHYNHCREKDAPDVDLVSRSRSTERPKLTLTILDSAEEIIEVAALY